MERYKPCSFFRSADMSLCQLFLQSEAAYQCVAELGEIGCVQFRDLNKEASNRRFINQLQRCDEMERKLRFIESEIAIDGVEIHRSDLEDFRIYTPRQREINGLEESISRLEKELIEINNTTKQLRESNIHLWETAQVLKKVAIIVDEDPDLGEPDDTVVFVNEAVDGESDEDDVETGSDRGRELRRIAGIIPRSRLYGFEKLLWRMCNGAVYLRSLDCDDGHPLFNESEKHSVFVIFFSGLQTERKVNMVCRGSPVRIYKWPWKDKPETKLNRQDWYKKITEQLEALTDVIERTFDYRRRAIHTAARAIGEWKIKVLKMRMVYHTLDTFSSDYALQDQPNLDGPIHPYRAQYLIGECWIPTAELDNIRDALRAGAIAAGSSMHPILHEMDFTDDMPPTHFTLNKFTSGFQSIVSAYGIAEYKELNPAPWIIISFPFLFAVMFGDVGHGLIIFLFALTLVIFEKKLASKRVTDEIFTTFFGGRYIILLMGLFSMYTGFIYNDFCGRSMNLFGSSWATRANNGSCWQWKGLKDVEKWERQAAARNRTFEIMLDPIYCYDGNAIADTVKTGDWWSYVENGFYSTIPHLMLDPVWDLAKNSLVFLNSMKMKMAVILGILQMTVGLVLSLGNHFGKRSLVDVYFMFLPQLLFLASIFGYLCLQIIVKWVAFPAGSSWVFGRYYPGSNCAPSLLIGLINMFLLTNRKDGFGKFNSTNSTYALGDEAKPDEFIADFNCATAYWYPGESIVEKILLGIAVLSIPVMLLGKPLYLWSRRSRTGHVNLDHAATHVEVSLSDVFLFQAIHTIEFVLGCISHTASYLRLWALSLAHAVLSDVMWTKVLGLATGVEGWLGAPAQFVIALFFGFLTVSILVVMEGLSAFLHALRLHWVEFQSKFYSGNGVKFEPFSFEEKIRTIEDL